MQLSEAHETGIAPWDLKVWENDHVTVFWDRFPVTPGHVLFVPKSDSAAAVQRALVEAQIEGDRLIMLGDCDGYNIGVNQGQCAGQTVMYPHIHLIPRRHGDCTNPTGGVRGVIPAQQNYRDGSYQLPVDTV